MVFGDFYTQVIAGAIAGLTLIGILWKHYADKIDKLEESTNQDEYLISTNIWATSVKNSVKDFVTLIQENLMDADPNNEDRYEEIFIDENRSSTIKERLGSLNKSYNSYLAFNQLPPCLIDEMEKMVIWLRNTGIFCSSFLIWGIANFLLEQNQLSMYPYLEISWGSFIIILGGTVFCLWRLMWHNKKYTSYRLTLRHEKTKYSSVIRKLT